jgi:hypothetical protein
MLTDSEYLALCQRALEGQGFLVIEGPEGVTGLPPIGTVLTINDVEPRLKVPGIALKIVGPATLGEARAQDSKYYRGGKPSRFMPLGCLAKVVAE